MADQTTQTEARLTAELNDLLQLDHDAVQAYALAIDHLESPSFRETLIRFRGDHERHITELGRLIRAHGGIPIELAHVPTGFFKLGVQRAGAAGGDREILLAFKANERQVRDKYSRHAERSHEEAEVADALGRAAADEERHYNWVLDTLESLGYGTDTAVGKAEGAFEQVHERAADIIEGAERGVMERAESARRGLKGAGGRMRSTAAGGLESVADVTDRAGTRAEGQGGVVRRTAPMAHRLADSLEHAARYLRTRDFHVMRADLERQVELHPMRSVLIALGAGFLVGKILR